MATETLPLLIRHRLKTLMPPTPTPLEPETQSDQAHPSAPAPDPDAPLTFVPHEPPPAPGDPPRAPVRFRTNRYGELEEHELVRLLDTIEDERARGRFRESIYMSVFFWIAVAWFVFYGPRYLWHAPQLINPAEAIRQHELTQLNLPLTQRHAGPPAPKPAPVSKQTIKQLQAMTKAAPPVPSSTPVPAQAIPPPSAVATNTPPPLPQPLPSAPAPRTPVSVPDAPAPQPNAHPNFSQPDTSIGHALAGARPGGGDSGSSAVRTPGGGAAGSSTEILSDTQGVDFSQYMRRFHSDVMRNWIPLLPEETKPPLNKQGTTYLRITILPDGRIGEMHLETSTHDTAIDKAAWGSIVSEGQFPPLPTQFHGPYLELRLKYVISSEIVQ